MLIATAPRRPSTLRSNTWGQQSYADVLFVKGFDAGKPIVYVTMDWLPRWLRGRGLYRCQVNGT